MKLATLVRASAAAEAAATSAAVSVGTGAGTQHRTRDVNELREPLEP